MALRARWWFVALGLVLVGGAALVMSFLQAPRYTATTQLFVSTTNISTSSDLSQGSQFSQERVASYARLITGRGLAERVIHRLNLPMTATQLSSQMEATAVTDTVLIDVTVTDPLPERARVIADTVAEEFTRYAAQLEAGDTNGASPVKVTITEVAQLPTAPSAPDKMRNAVLGGLIGLLIGAIAAILRVRLGGMRRRDHESGGSDSRRHSTA
jgi:capsular polysaccharide biosynthesis protein